MVAALFVGFVATTAAVVVATVAHHLGRTTAIRLAVGLGVWFAYVAVLGRSGLAANAALRPPGTVFVLGPVIAFLALFVARPSFNARAVSAVPIAILIGAHVFRVGVELFLHQLWRDGLVPRMLTYNGANVDVYVGASAPIAAWLATRGPGGRRLALAWNVLGLLALANVVARAILTAPGSLNLLHAEVPNRMIGTFPYLFIPAFFVPLAVVLHALAIRRLGQAVPVDRLDRAA